MPILEHPRLRLGTAADRSRIGHGNRPMQAPVTKPPVTFTWEGISSVSLLLRVGRRSAASLRPIIPDLQEWHPSIRLRVPLIPAACITRSTVGIDRKGMKPRLARSQERRPLFAHGMRDAGYSGQCSQVYHHASSRM